jgi:exodeoxyribonuclease VII large subunit
MDDLAASLRRCVKQGFRQQHQACKGLSNRLVRARPTLALKRRQETIRQISQRLSDQTQRRIRELNNRWGSASSKLKLLGPEQVLARGYSITIDESTGVILRNSCDTKSGNLLKSLLKNGEIKSRVLDP